MNSILVIEDEDPLRMMLTELLQGVGYRVLAAANGEQGVRMARAYRPDLVLTDVRMPVMNGHKTLAALREIPGFENVPVVIMTVHADLPDMRRGMELGADDYIAKPFENAELLRLVARHLAKAAQRQREAGRELLTLRRNLGQLLPQHFLTPLHDIIGCASVLALDAGLMPAAEIREYAQNIQHAGEQLHRQIENLLLYTNLEAGDDDPLLGPRVAVDHVVRQAAEAVARRHQRMDTLRFALAPVQAHLPREQLAKIITELVDNACRHTPATSLIHVSLTDGGQTFVLRVSDRGRGLPPHLLSDASSPATQAAGQINGSGLGLYLARRLTRLLGGAWEVDSSEEGGTTVTLTFGPPTPNLA